MKNCLRLTHFLHRRTGLAAALVLAVTLFSTTVTNADDVLTIGDKAPKLDIEHWVSDRDGQFSGFTGFEDDKVYIVEFWATWCGPCISSMPHIVETQDKYADKGVQIISVSNEDLETVEKFLKKTVRGEEDMTYAELTNAYCLTTDPDRSVSEDYMRAAGQNGIPTAFIVGKTGEIEWIGHPMRMDKPLEEVVEGKWDRKAFAEEFAVAQKEDLMMSSLMKMMRSGDFEKALTKIDDILANESEPASKQMIMRLKSMRTAVAMEVGGEEAIAAFAKMVEDAGDNPRAISRLTSRIISQSKSGTEFDEQILKTACEAAEKNVKLAEEAGKDKDTARAMDAHAKMLHICNKLDDAIAVQKKAVELSDQKAYVKFLEELEKEKADSEESDG